MSKFPVIESPCPLRFSAMPQAGKDHCGHCDRQVHNLDGMSRSQREAFMRSCAGQKVCVAYTVQRKAERRNLGLGITLLASLTGSGLAAAQDVPKASPAQHASETRPALQPIDTASTPPSSQLSNNPSDESTVILTAEMIAKYPLKHPIVGAAPPSEILFVALGGILDAGQARWADEDQIEPSALDTLPDIGELEWLPTKQP